MSTDEPPTRPFAMPGKLPPAHARPRWAVRHKVLTVLGSLAVTTVIMGAAITLPGAGEAGSRPAGGAGAVSVGSGSPAGARSAVAAQPPSPGPQASSSGRPASPSPPARSATPPSAAASPLAPGRSGKARQEHGRPARPLRSRGRAKPHAESGTRTCARTTHKNPGRKRARRPAWRQTPPPRWPVLRARAGTGGPQYPNTATGRLFGAVRAASLC
jgi:hypothetical protein